ncbi:unnamed protein product [Phytophthora fragariaefolia]|uniref:Unnamed protein product n=1 Tax=Phytophthora fragariaefolia TaxID=1490495 RepID=A0A9W7D3C1_9STRA|nr:unnamed protein product [Phytophthora fragariaefolia]
MCREAFLPVTGRKSDLVNRLLGVTTVVAPEQNTSAENARYLIDEVLLSAWFMAPFSTQDTKIGTANEENIADHIAAFLDKTSEHHIEKLKSYGLLCRLLCSSYKDYQKHKQNLPSFAAFCREAALALSERPRSQRPLSSISENVDQAPSHELGATFIYKKRLHFQTEKEWIDMRILNRSAHLAVSIVVSFNYLHLLTAGNVDSNRRHVAAELRCLLSTESRHRKSRPQSSRIQDEF